MSTENFNNSNGGQDAVKAFAVFFIASLLIHAALMWSLASLSPLYKRLDQAVFSSNEKDEPVPVEVIELPPGPASKQKPKKGVTRYSDRTNVVEKETMPEKQPIERFGRYSAARPALKAVPPANSAQGKQSIKNPSATTATAKATPQALSNKAGSTPQPTSAIKTEANDDNGNIKVKNTLKPSSSSLQKAQTGTVLKAPEPSSITEPSSAALPVQPQNATDKATSEKSLPAEAGPARPNLFLPGAKVEELTRNYEKEAPLAEKGKILDLNTSEWRYQSYLINNVKRRIEIYWEFPETAIRNGWQGKVQINFTINRDGSLSNVGVARSSGYPALDDAAVTAIRLAGPFPQFPENFAVENLTIKGQFEYNIRYGPEH